MGDTDTAIERIEQLIDREEERLAEYKNAETNPEYIVEQANKIIGMMMATTWPPNAKTAMLMWKMPTPTTGRTGQAQEQHWPVRSATRNPTRTVTAATWAETALPAPPI